MGQGSERQPRWGLRCARPSIRAGLLPDTWSPMNTGGPGLAPAGSPPHRASTALPALTNGAINKARTLLQF